MQYEFSYTQHFLWTNSSLLVLKLHECDCVDFHVKVIRLMWNTDFASNVVKSCTTIAITPQDTT